MKYFTNIDPFSILLLPSRKLATRNIGLTSLPRDADFYSCASTSPNFFVQKAEKYSFRASTVPLPSTRLVTIPT